MSGPEQELSVALDAADRFDSLFYSKSDEKFTVRTLLDEIFGDRQFERTLDVGPGAGHVSEPLARRSKQITMVERSLQFKEMLQERFANARVIVAPILEAELPGQYDAILFSHVLYYHQAADWLDLTRKLYDLLKPGGQLILVLNADSGDWWRIISEFKADLGPHMGFQYIPLQQFRKQLAELGPLKSYPYRYQMWIDSQGSWSEFIGKQMLELRDEQLFQANQERFAAFTKPFKQIDGSFVLDMRAEILTLSRP